MKSLQKFKKAEYLFIPVFFLSILYPAFCRASALGSPSLPPAIGSQGGSAGRSSNAVLHRRLPVYFIENRGQIKDRDMRFYLKHGGTTTYFQSDGLLIQAIRYKEQHYRGIRKVRHGPETYKTADILTLRLEFLGTGGVEPRGEQKLPGVVNYLVGRDRSAWKTGIPTYGRLVYRELYEGIDLAYQGTSSGLKYEIRLRPGADLGRVKLAYYGAEGLALGKDGELIIRTVLGSLVDQRPRAYQMRGGRRVDVPVRFRIIPQDAQGREPGSANGTTRLIYGFELMGDYDRDRPLIIDPSLSYSTYLGGTGDDYGRGIAVDGSGNIYVTGYTYSTDYPTKAPYQGLKGFSWDAFVTKLNPSGNTLVYSTFLGGNSWDYGFGIAVDGSGNAYVTGYTWSNDFPTKDPIQAVNNGDYDVFVTKLDPSGSALVYSTYIGGYYDDQGFSIAVDGSGSAYVTGTTASADFPTENPYQDYNAGGEDSDDVFVAKLNPTGNALVYSTYLGGNSEDDGYGIAVDRDGNAYVTGTTPSDNFPTWNPIQGTNAGGWGDAFVAKFNPSGDTLAYSTYLGGGARDEGRAIAVDNMGNALITGYTTSDDFPIQSPFQGARSGNSTDAFVAKLNPSGGALVYSTYLGGTSLDRGEGIAVDGSGYAYVTGYTSSTDFPTQDPSQAANAGSIDAFLARLNAAGSSLAYSTYLGGTDDDRGYGIAVDNSRNLYLTGWVYSTDFPTQNPFQATNAGSLDVFVAKFSIEDLGVPAQVPEVLRVGATFKEAYGLIHGGSSPYLEKAKAFLEARGAVFSYTDNITESFLSSVDAFYLGLLDTSLTEAEKDALVAFVQDSGFLFIQQDYGSATWFDPAQELLARFGISASSVNQSDDTYRTVGTHRIVGSPNAVTAFQGSAHSVFDTYGSDFTVLATDESGDPVLGVIRPGSGIVVASSDIDMWSDGAGWTNEGSRDLWENIWDYFIYARSLTGSSSQTVSGGTTAAAYKMAAFAASPNPGLLEALEEILGTYDKTQWRLFGWDPDAKSYVEINDPRFSAKGFDNTHGKGYFFISRNDADLNISGRKISGDVYVIMLNGGDGSALGGWNLIGNPFEEDVALSNLEVFQEGMAASVGLTDTGNELTSRALKEWVGGQYVDAEVMRKGGAYWIRNNTSDDVFLFVRKGPAVASLWDRAALGVSRIAAGIFRPLSSKAIALEEGPPVPPAGLVSESGPGSAYGEGRDALILLLLALSLAWCLVSMKRRIRTSTVN